MHSKLAVAVISVIIKNNKVLLLKRKNTPWMNWYWWLVWWRLDAWETMTFWAIREAKEEVWIEIVEENIKFKSLIQHKDDRWERIYFVIQVEDFSWVAKNMEEDKCEKIEWFDLNNLPKKITPQVEICLDAIKNKICYSEYWY